MEHAEWRIDGVIITFLPTLESYNLAIKHVKPFQIIA